ncbi:MAG: DUF2202 domain-containing protein [Erysipelotrichaceae bacterium]
MKEKTLIVSLITSGVLALVLGGVIISSMFQPVTATYGVTRMNTQNRSANSAEYTAFTPVADVTDLKAALTVLIEDEYKARAEYVALVEKFGEVTPFVNLIKAETSHINALANQFALYGLTVPADNGSKFAVVPATLAEAYAIGIQAETSNIALYENYLKQDFPANIEKVFTNLMNASVNHLATFTAYKDGSVVGVHVPTNSGRQTNGRWAAQK